MNKPTNELPNKWHCAYWYPSNTYVGDDVSEYDMTAHYDGKVLVLESIPNAEGSHMLVRLNIGDDNIATGNWHETTSPNGEFGGAIYSGAGQLTVNPQTFYMEGKWAGAGYDHKIGKMRIYSGNWEITPLAA